MHDTRTAPGWQVLLPPGWTTIPTEAEAARAASKRLIDQAFAGKPRDELVHARIELDTLLRRQAAQAAEAGARYVHALTRPIRGLPVSATLITVPLTIQDDTSLLDTLTDVLGASDGVEEVGETQVGQWFALRRVRRTRGRLDDQQQGPEITSTHVEYVVALPDDEMLVMAFTTSTEPVRRELVVLFDAIASSLERVPGADGNAEDTTSRP